MVTLKLTDEQMAGMGASSVEDVLAVIASANDAKAKLAEAAKANADMQAKLTTLEERLAAVETKLAALPQPVDVAALRKEISEEAGKFTMSAIAKIGNQALPSAETPPDVSAGDKAPAADDYKGQWEANKDLRAEFSSFEVYQAYAKAAAAGRVRINTNKH